MSRNAWSGALLTQEEALSRVGLAVTLGVALPATMLNSVSLARSGRNAGFSLFYYFNFFYSRLILIFLLFSLLVFNLLEIGDFFVYYCSCD